MPVPCNCCPSGMTSCWALPGGLPQPAAAMLCDGTEELTWFDYDGNEIDPSLIIECPETPPETNLIPVTVNYLPHPDQWPLASMGARRNKWTQVGAQPTTGSVTGAGTCRDGAVPPRIVRGPCAPNFGAWNLQVNDTGVPSLAWQDGGQRVWASVEGWVLVPLAVDPVPMNNIGQGGASNLRYETGTDPQNRALRPIGVFNQALNTSCACLAALGFGVAYQRVMAADGYFRGGLAMGYNIGSGLVVIPRNRVLPSDANHQVPTDPRSLCADILPQFYVTVNALQDPFTLDLFQMNGVTPLVLNGSCQVVTPV